LVHRRGFLPGPGGKAGRPFKLHMGSLLSQSLSVRARVPVCPSASNVVERLDRLRLLRFSRVSYHKSLVTWQRKNFSTVAKNAAFTRALEKVKGWETSVMCRSAAQMSKASIDGWILPIAALVSVATGTILSIFALK